MSSDTSNDVIWTKEDIGVVCGLSFCVFLMLAMFSATIDHERIKRQREGLPQVGFTNDAEIFHDLSLLALYISIASAFVMWNIWNLIRGVVVAIYHVPHGFKLLVNQPSNYWCFVFILVLSFIVGRRDPWDDRNIFVDSLTAASLSAVVYMTFTYGRKLIPTINDK